MRRRIITAREQYEMREAAYTAQPWEPRPDGGWTHPTGFVISPDEREGMYQLWAPTVSFHGPSGLAKVQRPTPDPHSLMDYAMYTQGGPKPKKTSAYEPHPDLLGSLATCGCVHTTGGRVLPQYRTAAADFTGPQDTTFNGFDDPAGWTYHKSFEPSQIARTGASGYASQMGMPDPHSGATDYLNARRTPESLKAVAQNYDSLPMHDPSAVKHFDAMRNDVLKQHDFMTNRLGIKTQVTDHDPYSDVHDMLHDINNNKRLQVLGTHVTGGHPHLDDATNDKFRAVHDFFGHAATGRSFDRHGEQAAYLAHSQMFSPQARPALATETRGQNSSLVYNGGFQPQKTALLHPQFYSGSGAMHLSAHDPYSITHHPPNWSGHEQWEAIHPSGSTMGVLTTVRDESGEPYVGGLTVHPDYQRKGVARALWEAAGRPPHDQALTPQGKAWVDSVGGSTRTAAGHQEEARMPRHILTAADRVAVWHTAAPEDPSAQWGADVMRHIDKNPEGVTLRDQVGDAPSSGHMVSYPGIEQDVSRSQLDPQGIRDYVREHADHINSHPDNYYGGWDADDQETGQPRWYHDVSRNIQDPRDAAEQALKGKQRAVYDLDHDEEVSTPDMVNRATSPGIGLHSKRR